MLYTPSACTLYTWIKKANFSHNWVFSKITSRKPEYEAVKLSVSTQGKSKEITKNRIGSEYGLNCLSFALKGASFDVPKMYSRCA